ncbi:MAG: glycosyltransferase [bacterium]
MKKDDIFISIIIPIYNAEVFLADLLRSISKQTLDNKYYEFLFIDNNSKDNSAGIINDYISNNPDHTLKYYFYDGKQSSYAARNFGINKAKGNIIAFTDVDCKLDENWLLKAYNIYLNNFNGYDLIAGKVEIEVEDNNNVWEQYDKKLFLNQENYVDNYSQAATANLFTKKEVFNRIGLFNEIISGGDKEWTNRAFENKYKLTYFKDIIVKHPSRKQFSEILKKNARVQQGKAKVENNIFCGILKRMISIFYFPKYIFFIMHLRKKGVPFWGNIKFCIGFFIIRINNLINYTKGCFNNDN